MKTLVPIIITVVCLALFVISRYFFFADGEDSLVKIVSQGFLIGAVFSMIFALFNKRNKNNQEN
ncbi:hypothetical protein [Chryseobacterium turcicum]|uniref:Uncharacterized protein n=1 Tax=Chryseobacterium turcicum TaxID=2898076 RepID=A0A9Q3YWV4_9FLAO|nr:hypothetical protein [Chryseobacterium turcicum]MCD1116397.1 hypothetical protein [Chryseobacterium turcicum]